MRRGLAAVAEFSHTPPATYRTPSLTVDPVLLERERILPAGAGGPYGSAYKLLRTQALKRLEQNRSHVAGGGSSPCANDGKTLTAINLAIAIAATTGRTALLVDFDLRNPSLHRRFGFEPAVGVEECLEARRPVLEALVKVSGYERLTLLPARIARGAVVRASQRKARQRDRGRDALRAIRTECSYSICRLCFRRTMLSRSPRTCRQHCSW